MKELWIETRERRTKFPWAGMYMWLGVKVKASWHERTKGALEL